MTNADSDDRKVPGHLWAVLDIPARLLAVAALAYCALMTLPIAWGASEYLGRDPGYEYVPNWLMDLLAWNVIYCSAAALWLIGRLVLAFGANSRPTPHTRIVAWVLLVPLLAGAVVVYPVSIWASREMRGNENVLLGLPGSALGWMAFPISLSCALCVLDVARWTTRG